MHSTAVIWLQQMEIWHWDFVNNRLCEKKQNSHVLPSCVVTKWPALSGTPAESAEISLPIHPSCVFPPLPPEIHILPNYCNGLLRDISDAVCLSASLIIS